MSGPWRPQHRPWCEPADCELDPDNSAEGLHVGAADTLLGAGWRTDCRIAETVPPEGEGVRVRVRVLLQLESTQLDAQRRMVDVMTSAMLDPDDAFQLGRTMLRLAALAAAGGGEFR
ncbi:MAG: hypothetical protein GEV09_25260 [Pseudonocardiaceae bacterium]|nr:hypothetical protein [Pseudonocardiaceae bacterium]